MVELSVEKRILLHLHKYSKSYQDAWEVPNAISQEGIGDALDILINNVSRAMKDLKAGGKVTERLAHIKGGTRKRRAYLLTEAGTRLAEDVLKEVMDLQVSYIGKDGKAAELTVGKILGQYRLDSGEAIAATDVLEAVRRNGSFDSLKFQSSRTAPIVGEATKFVDMTDTAPRLARFVGRAGVLAQIDAEFEGQGSPIIVVHGLAGLGKTSLALKVLEDQRGRRNIFYYRFHSWDSLANVAEALQGLLMRMGIRSKSVEGMLEMDVNSLALFIARELEAKPVLLVFDDFHRAGDSIVSLFRVLADVSQRFRGLRLLLGTRTVPSFYSRKEVTVDRLVSEVKLDGLDLDETRELLGEGHREEAVKKMHDLSRGAPLFLEILSGVDNVDAIEDMRKYIEEEVFSELKPGERTVLEGLSVHRFPVPPEAILVEGATFDDISALCRKSIVMELPHRRFEAHDLIKEFVYGRLSPEARTARHSAAAAFYRSHVSLSIPQGETPSMSAEMSQLEAVYHMRRSGDVKGAADLLLQVGPALLEEGHLEVREVMESFDRSEVDEAQWSEMLVLRGDVAMAIEDWPRALELYESALAAKKSFGADKATLASIHGMIGMAQMQVHRWEETERSHVQALRLYEEAGDERGKAKELMHLGMLHRNRKDWKRAKESYLKAKGLLEAIDDQRGIVVVHNNMAHLAMATGDLKAAGECIKKALALAEKENFDSGKAMVLFSRGEMKRNLGQLDEAKKDFDEATEIFRRSKEFAPAIRVQLTLGTAFLEADRPKEAQRALLRALDIYQFKVGSGAFFLSRRRATEDQGLLGRIYEGLSASSKAVGEIEAAREYRFKAIECFEVAGDQTAIARQMLDSGRESEDKGDMRAAKIAFERALTALEDSDDSQGKAAVHLNLARVSETLGDRTAAKAHLSKAISLGKSSGDHELVSIAEKEMRSLSSMKKR